MKPRYKGRVVDARLNVYGMESLKVAGMYHKYCPQRGPEISDVCTPDLSIYPTNVGSICFLYTMSFISRLFIFLLEVQNNDSTAFLIGEKVATIITENLRSEERRVGKECA